MPGGNVFGMDCVYSTDDMDFKNAHVDLSIEGDRAVVTITPDQTMSETELDGVVSDIETDMLKKVRMDLMTECVVYVKQDGASFEVLLGEGKPRVKGLKPVG